VVYYYQKALAASCVHLTIRPGVLRPMQMLKGSFGSREFLVVCHHPGCWTLI
jgi:hypothetical protein